MLGEFFEWWGRQLLDLVPARLRDRAGGIDALVVDAGEPGLLSLRRRRGGAEQAVARVLTDEPGALSLRAALANRLRSEPVVLRLPAGAVLERAVILPQAAERELDRVLGYEMERLTPFTADEVFWGFAIQHRDRVRAKLRVRLTIVQRSSIAPVLDLLSALGGRPVQLESGSGDGLRTMKLAHEGASRRGLSSRGLTLAAGGLALLVLASPFLRQSLALAELEDRTDVLAPRIAQVDALRRRIAGAGAGGDAVAAETRRLGDALEALAAMTDILPDDSYLTEFTMRERKITLSGLGASAPKLISFLSGDPRIRAPAFTAPVTRSETNHLDVFSIRAELAP